MKSDIRINNQFNWGAAILGDDNLFTIGNGGTPSTSEPRFWNGEIPWVTPTDLSGLDTATISATARTITQEGAANSSAKPLPTGTVVLSTRAPIGYASILGQEMAINQGCKGIIIKDSTKVNNEFLYFYLLTQTQQLKELGSGSTFRELSQHNLKSIEIPLPSIKEQTQIVFILKLISNILNQEKRTICIGEELKEALIADFFSKGMFNEELKETEIGQVPRNWEITPLGEEYRVLGGFAFKSSDFSDTGVPVVKIGNLQHGSVRLNDSNYYPIHKINSGLKKYLLKEGDVLIAMTGATTGKIAVVSKESENTLLNQRVGKFEKIGKKMDLLFARYFFLSSFFQQKVKENISQSAQGNISSSGIEAIKVPVPCIDEQIAIVHILSNLEKMIECEKKKFDFYNELFESLLYKLMMGEINLKKLTMN